MINTKTIVPINNHLLIQHRKNWKYQFYKKVNKRFNRVNRVNRNKRFSH